MTVSSKLLDLRRLGDDFDLPVRRALRQRGIDLGAVRAGAAKRQDDEAGKAAQGPSVFVGLSDGRILAGIVRGDTPEELTLIDAEGKKHVLPKKQIEEVKLSDLSLMPEGLNTGMSLQDFADVIAFLESLKDSRSSRRSEETVARWYDQDAPGNRQEAVVNHISLDSQHEAVKRFVLSLPTDPQGSILELAGRPIVCVLPAADANDATAADGPWTEEKNARRCDLIDREIDGALTAPEAVELQRLQAEMLRYRQKVAPLPLDEARKLHQELLARAAQAP